MHGHISGKWPLDLPLHFFPMCALGSTYLCELFLFPAPWDEGSLTDVRIWGLALKLACQDALLLCAVQMEGSWNPSALIS